MSCRLSGEEKLMLFNEANLPVLYSLQAMTMRTAIQRRDVECVNDIIYDNLPSCA